MPGRISGVLCFSLFAALLAWDVRAACLPEPEGPVLLTVTGHIGCTNGEGEARFDFAMLQRLGTVRLATETPWTEGRPLFEGTLARSLLDAVKAEGDVVHAVATDDYEIDIPVEDFRQYDVIIAWRREGRLLSRRELGPLWIIYPWSDHPELRTRPIRQRSVWQLERLGVR